MRRWRRLVIALAALIALAAVGYGGLTALTSRSQLARAVVWGESDRDPALMPTRVAATPARSYRFFWWVQDQRHPPARFALGKYGQHIYVVPDQDLVLVRFGPHTGYPHWPELLSDIARQLDESTSGQAS